ncbi:MAG TPA: hypothetical protein VIH82_12375, partial [Acidimicrobiia bacterium]
MAEAGNLSRERLASAPVVTDEDRAAASAFVRAIIQRAFVAVIGLATLGAVVATLIVDPALGDAPAWQKALAEGAVILLVLPVVIRLTVIPRVARKGMTIRSETIARERMLRADSTRRDLDARLGRAFELAESER